ncbi:MAG: GNAT family N-acetyltransferase [Candidatus Sulfotelmatobacter sp.]
MQVDKTTSAAIRSAVTGDIPAMVPVINAAFGIEGFLEGERTNSAQLAEMMKKGIFLLGHNHSGKVIASVHVEIRGRRGYFGMLAVDPASQGTGIGRAMVQAAEGYSSKQGCTDMDLTVLSLRPELPPLYRKLGYVETGIEEFRPTRPLKDGIECHCIIMSKNL